MAPRQNRRLSPDEIKADRAALMALKNIADYTPSNAAYSAPALAALSMSPRSNCIGRVRAQNALDVARDEANAAALALHDALLGSKAQVIAQYGPDTYELQALGLRRKSDRKRPMRRAV